MGFDNLEDFFPDVVDGGDKERNRALFWKEVDSFADEALLANGVLYVTDAGIGKSARRALMWFVAVREAGDEESIEVGKSLLKLL
jgi:hypothetical protein